MIIGIIFVALGTACWRACSTVIRRIYYRPHEPRLLPAPFARPSRCPQTILTNAFDEAAKYKELYKAAYDQRMDTQRRWREHLDDDRPRPTSFASIGKPEWR